MERWSKKIGNSVHFALDEVSDKTFLESFFQNRAFVPENEQEQKEFDDFSFISSATALAVYIAAADEDISSSEKDSILEEIFYQIKHNSKEYELISKELDATDKSLVAELFGKYKKEIEDGVFDLDTVVNHINKFFENNPYKRHYLIRFCYVIAYTESRNIEKEIARTDKLAVKLRINPQDTQRLKEEARIQVHK